MDLLYLEGENAAPCSLLTATVTRTQPQHKRGPVPATGLLVGTPGWLDVSTHRVKLKNSEPVLGSPFCHSEKGEPCNLP